MMSKKMHPINGNLSFKPLKPRIASHATWFVEKSVSGAKKWKTKVKKMYQKKKYYAFKKESC